MTSGGEAGELKPCPFCKSIDTFVERDDFSSCYVQCNDCGAQGPTKCQESDEEEIPGSDAAIAAWNTRQDARAGRDGEDAEMVERVAFAIHSSLLSGPGAQRSAQALWDCASGAEREKCRNEARAAIEAMRGKP